MEAMACLGRGETLSLFGGGPADPSGGKSVGVGTLPGELSSSTPASTTPLAGKSAFLEEVPPPPWAGGLGLETEAGRRLRDETVIHWRNSSSFIVTSNAARPSCTSLASAFPEGERKKWSSILPPIREGVRDLLLVPVAALLACLEDFGGLVKGG